MIPPTPKNQKVGGFFAFRMGGVAKKEALQPLLAFPVII